jgi:alpha-mannosidase
LWDKYEGMDEVLSTFRSACARLDEYPALTFAASSLQFYEWVQQHDLELFERIKARVAAGRWEVVGGWWVEADTNLPSEASFFKHAELSQAFTREHFGREISVAYLPDTFGHPATLPKILARSGFKYMVFSRPNEAEKSDLPANLFYWEYAGYRMLAYRLKHHYLQYGSPGPARVDARHLFSLLNDDEYRKNPVNCFFFGVGDHGGGPSIAEIEFYNRFIKNQPEGDAAYSTCLRFFEEAAQGTAIPVYRGDLHMHAAGCYSVVGDVKQAVRRCEHSLQFAARALAMNRETDGRLKPAWKTTLFNQFHDILPGSCSPGAADQARAELGGVESVCRDTAYAALKSVSKARPARAREGEFRIFNTLPFDVTVPLQVESFAYYKQNAAFRDEDNNEIPVQEVLPSVRCANQRWEFVDSLPAQGFKAYTFDNGTLVDRPDRETIHFEAGDYIATAGMHVSADGSIMLRPRTGEPIPVLERPMRFLVLDDQSDTWGHGVKAFDAALGAFEMESSAVLYGPVTSKLYQRWRYGGSTLEVTTSLYPSLAGVYLDVAANWVEKRKILKMEIHPAGAGLPTMTMQGAGGSIEREADGRELPLHHWLWLPGRSGGLAVVQDGAFACDAMTGRLRLTLVRSSLYGFHDPARLSPDDPQWHTDQGSHRIRLCLLPRQSLGARQLERFTAAFLEPYPVIRESR